MSIYELVSAGNIVEYWLAKNVNREPLIGETLFPYVSEIGTKIEWIKGANNVPVALTLSAYDSKSIRRNRPGFEIQSTKMPFYKTSKYIDEEMRQNLNNIIQSNNQNLIDRLLSKIFNDQIELIKSAYIAMEKMRMQALTTGTITLASNGQSYSYDFGMPTENKITVTTSWSAVDADIIGDLNSAKATMKAKGVKLTRAMCNSSVITYLLNNTAMKNAIYVFAGNTVNLTEKVALDYIYSMTNISIYVNDDVYGNEDGTVTKFIPDNTFVMFPDGDLGETHMGMTPEESDLLSNSEANVSVTNGIAVTSSKITDPVTVDVKVSMVCLPSFERANEVVILDVVAE